MALLMRFAVSMGMENHLEVLSLGKGQGPRAEEVIKVRLENNMSQCVKQSILVDTFCREAQHLGTLSRLRPRYRRH